MLTTGALMRATSEIEFWWLIRKDKGKHFRPIASFALAGFMQSEMVKGKRVAQTLWKLILKRKDSTI
jgi:hypothetical protein